MHFLSDKPLPRRTFVRGALGATFALPYLDAMVPVGLGALRRAPVDRTRLVAIEMVHGAAGLQRSRREPQPLVAGRNRPNVRPRADGAEVARRRTATT